MKWLKWFIAGFLAVPLGHQIALWVLNAIHFIDRAPFSMQATKPFGVPSWISLSFWGGVWGIILGMILWRKRGNAYWILAIVIGALAPTLVAGLVIMPLRGMPIPRDPKMFATGLIVNGVWGFATAAFHRVLQRR